MNHEEKTVALEALYARIEGIAKAMGGTASRVSVRLSLPSAMTATPQSDDAPALVVEMPDNFGAEFAPSNALRVGNALTVRVVRTHEGLRKTDWQLNFVSNGWQRTQMQLSDDEIQECLTPDGPKPAYH
jgi:hypothetical protein